MESSTKIQHALLFISRQSRQKAMSMFSQKNLPSRLFSPHFSSISRALDQHTWKQILLIAAERNNHGPVPALK
jgi:hypothetical protein